MVAYIWDKYTLAKYPIGVVIGGVGGRNKIINANIASIRMRFIYMPISIIWHLKQIYIDLIQKINVFIQIVSDNGDGQYNYKIKTLLL